MKLQAKEYGLVFLSHSVLET